MGDMMTGMGAWMGLWAVLALVALGAVIAGAVWLGRNALHTSEPSAAGPDEPREILRRRYAAGEIHEDEYLRRMSGLDQR